MIPSRRSCFGVLIRVERQRSDSTLQLRDLRLLASKAQQREVRRAQYRYFRHAGNLAEPVGACYVLLHEHEAFNASQALGASGSCGVQLLIWVKGLEAEVEAGTRKSRPE